MRKRVRKWREFFCVLLCFCLVVSQAACGSIPAEEDEMAEIYDNAEKLANNFSSYRMENAEQTIDGMRMSGTFEKLNGMVMFWTYEPAEDTVADIRYLLKVSAGKVKLVLVDGNNRIETVAEMTRQEKMEGSEAVTLSIRAGYNRLKLVGTQDAVVEFDIEMNAGGLIGI